MKVASYNIHFGVGTDGKLDLERALRPVLDVDVIALQEVDSYWDRSSDVDQAEELRALLPDHDLAYGVCFEVFKARTSGEDDARGRPRPRRRSGNVVLSRYPIQTVRNFPLPKYGAAGPKLDLQKSLLEVSILTPIGPLRVYNTHLCHLAESQRILQAEVIMDIHQRAVPEGPPLHGGHPSDPTFESEESPHSVPEQAIMMGDLNCLPNTDTYATLVGATGARWKRVPRRGGFVDAWTAAGHDEQDGCGGGGGPSPAATSGDGTRRIDYCLVSSGLAGRVASAEVRDHGGGSDHRPVVVTFA